MIRCYWTQKKHFRFVWKENVKEWEDVQEEEEEEKWKKKLFKHY